MDGISWWSEDILRQTTSGTRQNSLNSNSLSLEQEQQHLGRHFLIEYHGEGTYLKFIYSEKAKNFCEISTVDLTVTTYHKSMVEISQKVVAFSEYMNFN